MMSVQEASPAEDDPPFDRAVVAYRRLSGLLLGEDFTGWDPYDGLRSPWLRATTPTTFLRRAAIQGVKRAPIGARRLLGVKPCRHTKGLALCVMAYARTAAAGVDPMAKSLALSLAHDLIELSVQDEAGIGWGYDFDVQTRWGYYRCGTPNAVVTAFAGHALLDAAALHDDKSLVDAARLAASYASKRLAVEEGNEGYFAYYAGSQVPIHNASLLVASMIARCVDPGSEASDRAEAAVKYSLNRQQQDGSWRYGEAPGLEWVDGFHTAYLLLDLDRWNRYVGTLNVDDALGRGLDLYMWRLIDADGVPRASLTARYPVDIHACATAISVLSTLTPRDSRASATASRVLEWTLAHMSRADGGFAFQRHRLWRDSRPFFRWSDAHMLLALADIVSSSHGRGSPRQPPRRQT